MSSKTSFESGIELEEALIEFRALVQSYMDVAGDSCPPLLFTLDRGFGRVEKAMSAHQKVLHTALQGVPLHAVTQ
jgi:hypothetical protein